MSFFPWLDPETRRNLIVLGSWKDAKIRRVLVLITVSVVFLVGFTSFLAGIPFATNPTLCGQLCHATNAEFQSWSRSAHANVACHFCHLDRPSEKVVNPVSRAILSALDAFQKPINADSAYSQKGVPKERCLYCHAPGAGSAGAKNIGVKGTMHNRHLDAGLDCTVCHNRVAHLGAEDFEPLKSWQPGFKYRDFTTMKQGCWRCHGRNSKYVDSEALALVGGKKPSSDCRLCHDRPSSLRPGAGEASHETTGSLNWKAGARHGRAALADFNVCLACHPLVKDTQAAGLPDCSSSCHRGVVMPHNLSKWAPYLAGNGFKSPSWLKTHALEARAKGVKMTADSRVEDPAGACSICHNREGKSPNFCQSCHHKKIEKVLGGPAAPWAALHSRAVLETGAFQCRSCHEPSFCSACHTRTKL